MDIITWAAHTQQNHDDLTALGMPNDYATNVLRLVELFFHEETHSRYQARSKRKAEENNHSVETLAVIWQASRNIEDPTKRWQFREALCGTTGDTHDVQRTARRIKKHYVPKKVPKDGVRTRRVGDKITVSITGSPDSMQHLVDAFNEAPAAGGSPTDPVDWVLHHRPSGAGDLTAHAVMTIDDIEHVLRGDSVEDDVLVQLTDGTVLTGMEVAQLSLRDRGFITLLSPGAGPINVYEAAFEPADAKKRRGPKDMGHAA
ncbi:hypothetical protein [Corynebacterium sp. HMSC071B10]|uniref:hypothetical protein n=1 Tax=Corynebacterium sp. HMSC071B10 TaxID=1739494 RepID=UPI000A9BA078|nr:hypothetical protein [Corynebacterium sp. HMSC071B10]